MPDSVGTAVFARPRPCSDCSGFSKNSRHRIPTAPHRPRVIVWHNCARQNPRSMFCQETPSSSALFLLVPRVSPFGTTAPDGTLPFIHFCRSELTESSLVSSRARRHQLSQLRPTEPSVIVPPDTPSSSTLFLMVLRVSPFGTTAPDGTSPFIHFCHSELIESPLVSPRIRCHELSQLRPTEPSVIVLQENSSIHFRTGFRCPPCITDLASGLGCA